MATSRSKARPTELEGEVEEKVGEATDDPDLEAEGVQDQAIGEAEQAIGEAKEAWSEVRDDG